jgi:hypothetical protein
MYKPKSAARKKRDRNLARTPLFHYKPEASMLKRVSTIAPKNENDVVKPLMGMSLFCLSPTNKFRNAVNALV